MSNSVLRLIFYSIASLMTGYLLFLIYPNSGIGWLAWVALIPLFLVLSTCKPISGFLYSYLAGIVCNALIFYWLFEVGKYNWFHHLILVTFLGAYFAIFGLLFSLISDRSGPLKALIVAPFLWVAVEYLRANFPLLPAPWPLLAYSQYQYIKIIQIVSFTGVYGLSFLLVLFNSTLAALVLTILNRRLHQRFFKNTSMVRKTVIAMVSVAAILIAATFGYGIYVTTQPIEGQKVEIAVVQANISQDKKWDRKYSQTIMRTYSDLTTLVSKNENKPDLIIWPESATPMAITQVPTLYSEIRKLARETDTFLFLGSASHVKFRKKKNNITYQNSAFLIDPQTADRHPIYSKIILFPFGEYAPLKNYVPWSKIGVPDIGSYQPGENYTVFQVPAFQFSATICWENGFPGLVRKLVQNGAQFIVNITNEAWFGRTAAPYQFLTYNSFRAVEHRRYVVRCTNTGVSCFIDPYGRIIARVEDKNGNDIFVKGTSSHAVTAIKKKTIYTRYGDWPVWVSIVITLIFIALALMDMAFAKFRQRRE